MPFRILPALKKQTLQSNIVGEVMIAIYGFEVSREFFTHIFQVFFCNSRTPEM